MNTELKPCPICGAMPEIFISDRSEKDDAWKQIPEEKRRYVAACVFQGAVCLETHDYMTREEAVSAWNEGKTHVPRR